MATVSTKSSSPLSPPPPSPDLLPLRGAEGALAARGLTVVVDVLRAFTTAAYAFARGARDIVLVSTVEEAFAVRQRYPDALLIGEVGGRLIPGFDLDNSPQGYTRERVQGRTIIFTTTNGTAALLHARQASRILVGSFANLTAVCDAVADDVRPVHILCAGTRDEITMDDCLPAGAMTENLVARGRLLLSDDSARLCRLAWLGARALPGGIAQAMRESRGGRNLVRLKLGHEVDFCATIDTLGVVPVFDPARGEITL